MKKRIISCFLVPAFAAGLGAALYHKELGRIWAGIYQRYFLSEAERARQKEEQLRQETAAFYACRPEKPLSREELLARAMQNYWRREMERLWALDKALGEDEIPPVTTHITDNTCGLVRDKRGNPLTISRDTCYPWKIREYNSEEELRAKIRAVPYLLEERWKKVKWKEERDSNTGLLVGRLEDGLSTYEYIVQEILHGQVMHPERELPYLPGELKNDRASFSVIHHEGARTSWYGPDCCKLVTYDEIKEKEVLFLKGRAHYLPPDIRIEDVTFLQVTSGLIDHTWHNGREGVFYLSRGEIYGIDEDSFDYTTLFFEVSPCGAIR